MPEVEIEIGGRSFEVACQAGEEHYLQSAARMLDAESALTSFDQDKLMEQMEESGALRAVEKAHRMHAEATRS